MEYAQLNVDGTYSHQITTHGDVVWDSTHQCQASALTQEEAILFRVVPLLAVAQPSYDPLIESALRDGGELVDGRWQYRWTIPAVPKESPVQSHAHFTPDTACTAFGIHLQTYPRNTKRPWF